MASTGLNSSAPQPDARPGDGGIVIGIGSYNSAGTIGAVVRAVRQGLDGHFGAGSGCIVLADGGSTDRTREQAREALDGPGDFLAIDYEPLPVDPLMPAYHGLAGRPRAIQAILAAAGERGASACAFVDAGLTTLEPDWIPRLIEPALGGDFDYVSPYYLRPSYGGAITKSIVYPMFRALYGVRLRQPAAGEFGCSLRLARHLLEQPIWEGDAQSGIDLWVATAAVAGGFRVCEALLGVRGHQSSSPPPDLSVTLEQVAGALFSDVEVRPAMWQRVRGSAAVPALGDPPPDPLAGHDVNVDRLIDAFRLGYGALRDIWAWIVPPRTILQLKRLTEVRPEQFRLGDELWAQIVYDFAVSYHLRSMPRDHLLRAMTPLYLGWLGSFVVETRGAGRAEIDARLEQLCVAFEAGKAYLISRWRWPERFRS